MPIDIFCHRVIVEPSDIDENQHANNTCYLRWMNEAALAHSAANGWFPLRYVELGASWFARKHTIEYLAPAKENDRLAVVTWVSDWKGVRSTRQYRFFREHDGVLATQAETLWAFVDLKTGKPTKIVDDVTNAFVVAKPDEKQLMTAAEPVVLSRLTM